MNNNYSPIEIPENWDFYRTSFGETPVSIRLNLALKSIAPIADFPVVVRAIVKMQHPYDNGFSSQEEFETLPILRKLFAMPSKVQELLR